MAHGGQVPMEFGSPRGGSPWDDLDAIDAALALSREPVTEADVDEVARQGGEFGGAMGDEYVGGEEAWRELDSETDADAARTSAAEDDAPQGVAVRFRFLGVDDDGFLRLGGGEIVEGGDQ